MNKMCSYYEDYGYTRNSVWNWHENLEEYHRPRKKVCPVCGRRVQAAIRFCHDGCCTYYTIPKHKRKKWWKKSNIKDKRIRRKKKEMKRNKKYET